MTSTKSVLWIFILGCLLSSARLIVDTPGVAREAQDTSLRSGQRFSELRDALPKAGVVGYIGESGDFAVGHYYLTQYALAPLRGRSLVRARNRDRQFSPFPADSISGESEVGEGFRQRSLAVRQ